MTVMANDTAMIRATAPDDEPVLGSGAIGGFIVEVVFAVDVVVGRGSTDSTDDIVEFSVVVVIVVVVFVVVVSSVVDEFSVDPDG